ncbi:hypothetical protein [Microvirga flavescens]|uniref:hypothetical protein n=1 Tax=Microvirga flavescens TaxID=2249811 RepID=UPI0013006B8D|nr:hypothetical protein [Microvirga flavescens]
MQPGRRHKAERLVERLGIAFQDLSEGFHDSFEICRVDRASCVAVDNALEEFSGAQGR